LTWFQSVRVITGPENMQHHKMFMFIWAIRWVNGSHSYPSSGWTDGAAVWWTGDRGCVASVGTRKIVPTRGPVAEVSSFSDPAMLQGRGKGGSSNARCGPKDSRKRPEGSSDVFFCWYQGVYVASKFEGMVRDLLFATAELVIDICGLLWRFTQTWNCPVIADNHAWKPFRSRGLYLKVWAPRSGIYEVKSRCEMKQV
jgi:hypothetical protein